MASVNYDNVLDDMRAAGLQLDYLELNDGRTHRVRTDVDKERRGWYRLSEHLIGDEYYIIGAYGIWRGNDNGKVAVKPGKKVKIDPAERAAINARIKADAAKAKAQRDATAEKASQAASYVWRQYQRDGESEYLTRKGVKAHGLRFHPSGTLAIPMADTKGKIWGLQVIRGKDRGTKLEKQYWPKGLAKQGHYHQIGTPRGLILIAEGYATAATVHQATGFACVVAFDAGNLLPVAQTIRKQYPRVKILICADDDYRTVGNPGIKAASTAAMAVDGLTLAPVFAEERPTHKKGPTDWNDLHALEGLGTVRAQIEGHLAGLDWFDNAPARASSVTEGDGEMVSRLSVDDAVLRYWGTYGMGGKALFDEVERRIVAKDDVMNLLPSHGWDQMKNHPDWRVARDSEIGFDPTEQDPSVRCNLFGGWPTTPQRGECSKLLELLEYLCDGEGNYKEVYDWCLKWLAFPLQNRGAKMHSAIVVHGPQGTGKSLFFESYSAIFGAYSRVLGQEALEDKFNADWAEKKLFILADEVLARQDMYHIKNRLKGYITGQEIRVNPKNVAAHTEKNQMNIVFLSNERQPLVLENDDRRHCVIWVPPKPPDKFIMEVVEEIKGGGIAALHQYLLDLDLAEFSEATRPPMTASKMELIEQSTSSEDRFVNEWRSLELEGPEGNVMPFCPCQGSHLYKIYERWCEHNGERKRRMQDLIGHCNKLHGWTAGKPQHTWNSLNEKDPQRKDINRKLVIPSGNAIEESLKICQSGDQQLYKSQKYDSRRDWLTTSYFAFMQAGGL